MITQELTNYIRQQLQQGTPREKIQETLITQQWNADDIREAFSALDHSTTSAATPVATSTSSDLWAYVALGLGLVTLVTWLVPTAEPASEYGAAFFLLLICSVLGVVISCKSLKSAAVIAPIALTFCLINLLPAPLRVYSLYAQGYIIPHTYSDSQVSFTIPKRWVQATLPGAEQKNVFIYQNGDTFIPRITYYCNTGISEDLATVGEAWTHETSQEEGVAVLVHAMQQMGGQNVYVLLYTFPNKAGTIKAQYTFYKKGDKMCTLILFAQEATYQKIYANVGESFASFNIK